MKSIDGLSSHDEKNVVKNTTFSAKSAQKSTQKAKTTPKMAKKVEKTGKTTENSSTKTNAEVFVAPVESFDFDFTDKDIVIGKEKTEISTKVKQKNNKKGKKKVSKARRIITTILLVIVLGLIGFVGYGIYYGSDLLAKITGTSTGLLDIIGVITSDDLVELKTDQYGRTNILIFGTSGFDMSGNEGNGVHDGAALTDSIMVLSFDQETYDVAMVNLPRDLKAGATCTATGKINEVYWCNNMYKETEDKGATALANKITEILGVDIQYYVHINWGTVITLVDALGGVDVTLDEDINDRYYTGAVYQAGVEYHLDGWNAVALARARHGTAGGDFSRGNSQQKILMAIKDKLMENGIGWTKALDIIKSVEGNIYTNISLPEMKTGLWLIGEMNLDSIRQVPLIDYENGIYYMTTATINNISYVIPSEGMDTYYKLHKYIREQFTTPVVEEEIPEEDSVQDSGEQ